MKIRLAVITAAAPGQNLLPLQRFVDRHRQHTTALQLIIHEVVDAGIKDIGVVITPGEQANYLQAAGDHAGKLTFVEQDQPRGYGDALHRTRDFVGREPFLHLVGDHLYISSSSVGCARQVVELAEAEACAVSAVQSTRENKLALFGAIGGRRVANRAGLYEVTRVVEKPTPTQAEQELVVAGLRASHYLCFFGIHVLTPTVMDLLATALEPLHDSSRLSGPVQLSSALSALAQQERYLAMEVAGARYNIGVKYGLLFSQLALALSGRDRDNILSELLELVATTNESSIR